ncbi:uncharacterized protein BN665_00376 [Firmicutes bacterium CAG:460]|jgi:hypothetical protein|uniref:hypothetical protein n=1 Tax=Candidatus Onthocola sp. TaxID=3085646 RepID=UPI00033C1533|nr:hypothetical protein [Bacillota bacterium]CDE49184.1 uncharacterized protein BN665_00376 [Firmicutes bacterium CAG:460]
MKKRINAQKMIKMAYKETKRSSLAIYLILRFLVVICMILQIIRGDLNNALLCLLSLVLLFAPLFIQNKYEITLPDSLEISIYLFIFSAEILGEINNFYGIIPHWDTCLHTINGFLATAVGFSLVDLLNKNSKDINLSPFYLCLVAFCFSMTIGILWEFFEYGGDKLMKFDMQKDTLITNVSSVYLNPDNENKPVVVDNIGKTEIFDKDGKLLYVIDGGYLDIGLNDTMKDLFVNFIGALVFSFFAYIGLKNNKRSSVVKNFVPIKEKRKMAESVKSCLMK